MRCQQVITVAVFASIAFSPLLDSLKPHYRNSRSVAAQEVAQISPVRLGSKWLRQLNSARTCTFSTDGNLLASGGGLGAIRIWDLHNRTLLRELSGSKDYGYRSIAFSPDGSHLAGLASDGRVSLWQLDSSEMLWEVEQHEEGKGLQLAFFPSGKRIASLDANGLAVIIDATTGQAIEHIGCKLLAKRQSRLAFALSPDGDRIAFSDSCSAEVVSIDDPQKRTTFQDCHGTEINSVAFSPDGKRLLTCGFSTKESIAAGVTNKSYHAERKLWDLETRELLQNFPMDTPDEGRGSAIISSGGQVVATSTRAIAIWDETTAEKLVEIPNHNAHANWYINGFAVAADGGMVAVAKGASLLLWDTHTGEEKFAENEAHRGVVTHVAFSPDGLSMASCCRQGEIRVWDRGTAELRTLVVPTGSKALNVDSVNFSPDGATVISAGTYYSDVGFEGTVSLLNAHTGQLIKTKLIDNRGCLAAYSTSGEKIIVGWGSPAMRRVDDELPVQAVVWDAALRRRLTEPQSFNGRIIAAYCDDHIAYLVDESKSLWKWKLESSEVVAFPIEAKRGWLHSASFSTDGSILVTGGLFDEKFYVWDTETGRRRGSFEIENAGGCNVAISPDGRLLAAASIRLMNTTEQYPSSIYLWDTLTNARIAEFPVASSHVTAIVFSHDGSELLTGHNDGTLSVWSLAEAIK